MAELVSIKRNVDVSPGQAAPAVFHCSQGDVGSKIILGLLNNGTAYSIPSGVTVTIEGSESNGSIFTPISATASGSDITFYLTGEMTAVAGPAICQAVLKSGSNILGTANFTLEVESSPMGADAPPVFTDAGWTWMLNKLNTEFVPALGNETIIDAIDSKADQSDLTALSNTVAGHTGSITVLNNTVNTLNHGVTENRQNIATVGDELDNLKADVSETNDRLYYGLDALGLLEVNPNNWEIGHIYTTDGTNNPYFSNRIRTKDYVSVSANDALNFTFTDGVIGVLYRYSDNGYLGYVALYNGTQYINDTQTTRLRFVLINTTTISKFDLLKHIAISSYYDQIGTIIKALSTVATNINVTDANASSYPDANDFPNRTIINVLASANVAHKPFDSCTIITTGFNTTDTVPYGGSKQIAINNADGAIASRSYSGSAWSTWFNVTAWIPTVATLSSNIAVSSSNLSGYPNVDNFPNRSIIHILTSANVENKPFATCTVITTGFSTTGTAPYGGSKQIALSDTGSIASRSHNGTFWSAWTYSDHVYYATPSNYIEVIENALYVTDATVILESGTYNLFDATHDETYWKNKRPATRYCGINLKNGIKIIGDGLVNLDANYTGSDEDIKENFSVFNIAGSCEIRNINIDASNICYLVHDDPRIGSSQNNRCIIHGCKLIHNGTDHTFTSGAPMCIGAGEGDNSYREYTDNVVDSTYDRSVNVHTATSGKGKYIITGNYFVKGTLGFTAFGDGTGRIEGIISNNSLPSDIVNRSNGASTPYTFNNVVRS